MTRSTYTIPLHQTNKNENKAFNITQILMHPGYSYIYIYIYIYILSFMQQTLLETLIKAKGNRLYAESVKLNKNTKTES